MPDTVLHPLTEILERTLWYGSLKELATVAELEERFRPLDDEPEYPGAFVREVRQ